MTDKIKQLQEELEAYEVEDLKLQKEEQFIAKQRKAVKKKIKAQQELIESVSENK